MVNRRDPKPTNVKVKKLEQWITPSETVGMLDVKNVFQKLYQSRLKYSKNKKISMPRAFNWFAAEKFKNGKK